MGNNTTKNKMTSAEKIEQAENTNMLTDLGWLALFCIVLYKIFN